MAMISGSPSLSTSAMVTPPCPSYPLTSNSSLPSAPLSATSVLLDQVVKTISGTSSSSTTPSPLSSFRLPTAGMTMTPWPSDVYWYSIAQSQGSTTTAVVVPAHSSTM